MFCKFLASNEPCFFSTLRYFSTATHGGPLKGIKVLDLTRIIAGPTCTLLLADFGADVYKIENPSIGDDCRRWPPIFKDGQSSSTYISLNRNKKSIAINFKTEEGQELLHDMAKKCDVLVENYVPGTLKKYNMDYDTLRKIAPQLIYCSITGFGSEGPYAKKLGVDLIASSMTGHLYITGTEDGQPCRSGISSIDIMTGLRASSAILAALYEKKSTGLGRKIETDLFSTAVVSLKNYAVSYLNLKTDVEKMGTGHNFVVPYKSFKSKDGYFTAGAINDGQFVLFTELIGKPELSKDERFKTAPNRSKNRKELMSLLENVFIKKTTKEWCQIFENSPLPNAPLNNLAQNVTTTPPTLRLKCRKPKSEKSVKWNEGTVDNEHMNKKKSKCCCIYKKPKQRFDESSDSESDECENCFGHVEVKKTKKLAKTSCSEQSSATTSNEVLEHAQQINPSGMTTVSS